MFRCQGLGLPPIVVFQVVNERKVGERFVIRLVAENVKAFVGFNQAASFIFYCSFLVEN